MKLLNVLRSLISALMIVQLCGPGVAHAWNNELAIQPNAENRGNPEQAQEGANPLPRGQQMPRGGREALAAARAANNDEPLTAAQTNNVVGAVRDANRVMGGQGITPAAAAQLGALVATLPAGDNVGRNQAVNAAVWGSKFVKNGDGQVGAGFTLQRTANGVAVQLNAGSSTNNMRIVVPNAAPTGVVGGRQGVVATEANSVSFTMTRADVGRGSGNFTQTANLGSVNAQQNQAFNGVQGIATHTLNNGPAANVAPTVVGQAATINFARTSPTTVNANWVVAQPSSTGSNAPQTQTSASDANRVIYQGSQPPAGESAPRAPSVAAGPVPGTLTVTESGQNLTNHNVFSGPMPAQLVNMTTPGHADFNRGVADAIRTNPSAPVTVVFNPNVADTSHSIVSVSVGGQTFTPGSGDAAVNHAPTDTSHAPSGSALPPSDVIPAPPAAGAVRPAPMISAATVNTSANTNGEAVASRGARTPLAVQVTPQPTGNQSLVVVQLPAAMCNNPAMAVTSSPSTHEVQITGTMNGAPMTITANATAVRGNESHTSNDLAGRNGALAFTVPTGFSIGTIRPTVNPGVTAPTLSVTDMNRAMFSMSR